MPHTVVVVDSSRGTGRCALDVAAARLAPSDTLSIIFCVRTPDGSTGGLFCAKDKTPERALGVHAEPEACRARAEARLLAHRAMDKGMSRERVNVWVAVLSGGLRDLVWRIEHYVRELGGCHVVFGMRGLARRAAKMARRHPSGEDWLRLHVPVTITKRVRMPVGGLGCGGEGLMRMDLGGGITPRDILVAGGSLRL